MREQEESLFKAFVEQSASYFEYGMGGSTVYAAQVVRGPVVAVDSDRAWIGNVATEIASAPFPRNFLLVDIGPTRAWGFPTSDERRAIFPTYSSTIADHAAGVDLCLVDGRFRVACFLQALRHLSSDAVIGIHDFRSRAHYHAVLDFARPIAEAGDMTFFVARRFFDTSRLEDVLAEHVFDAR